MQSNQIPTHPDSGSKIESHQLQGQDSINHQVPVNNDIYLNQHQAPPPNQIIQHQLNPPPPMLQMPPQIVPPPNNAPPQIPIFSVANPQQIIAKPPFQINGQIHTSQPQSWVPAQHQNWLPNTSQVATHNANFAALPYQATPNQFGGQNQNPAMIASQVVSPEFDIENRQLNQQNVVLPASAGAMQNNVDASTLQTHSQNVSDR